MHLIARAIETVVPAALFFLFFATLWTVVSDPTMNAANMIP
ncbi:hypothetical protein [Amorphus orientalis]|uniref:Uncharacterized protein n=1 Tax=Amorphus orientalis TaxID=649198 RepID=A0AAE3VNI4_9HYPH|nr:hypothetical protein [Amorphus orientalis]MDQ0315168.1 hypothetical protein [Amorphus orientalis]